MLSSIILTLCASAMLTFRHFKVETTLTSDKEIMFKQLQSELIMASNIYTQNNSLYYTKDNQEFILCLDQNRLVKKEGYLIYLYNVDRIEFDIQDYVYLTIYQKDSADKRVIGVYHD